jgi:hypothetical protein
VVDYGSAAGVMMPPVFVLPGKTVPLEILNGCSVERAALTTTNSGFMNSTLLSPWLAFFAAAVPAAVALAKPLLLIMDGCSSHYSVDIVDAR